MPLNCDPRFSRIARITRLDLLSHLDGFCLIVSIVKAQATHNPSYRAKKAGHHWSAFFTPHNAPNSKEAGPPTPAFLFVVPKCPSIDLAAVRLNGSVRPKSQKLDLLEAELQAPGREVRILSRRKKRWQAKPNLGGVPLPLKLLTSYASIPTT
jgi:hypothetical protein